MREKAATKDRRGGGALKVAGFADGSLEKWREAGFDRNSLLADPLFVDFSKGDYRLRHESPALELRFKPIPFDKIGVRGVEALKED